MTLSTTQIRERIGEIIDPDLDISIVDLGLIREIKLDAKGSHATIKMTLTNPGCGIAPLMVEAVEEVVREFKSIKTVKVDLVFHPPWDPYVDPTEDGKAELGIWE